MMSNNENYLKKELYSLIQTDESIFDFIQESALDGMWYWDIENMENEWMNSKFWTTLGYDPKLMPHKASAWQDIINQDDLKLAIENCQLHFENPKHKYDQIVRYKHKKGHIVWIRCRGLAIRDNAGSVKRFLGAHTEVTSLKEKEKELTEIIEITKEQNARLLNFAHIVSHNLRSHSSNFEMLLEIFFNDHPEFKNEEAAKYLLRASNDLKETIFHLNEVVSINTKFSKNLSQINLTEAVNRAIENVDVSIASTEVKIENNLNDAIFVTGIRAYIDSILHNFISNAIKYRASNRASVVEVSSYHKTKYVVLEIKDNGLGIDLKRYGDKLYNMYSTFHGNKDAKGIGLFISKNQIEALGGKVEVESEVDRGTTFKIFFLHKKESIQTELNLNTD